MAAWMMPAAMLGGSALSGIMNMFGSNAANSMSNSLAQQQMMQQQGFVNAQRMDALEQFYSNQQFQREMNELGIGHAHDMATRNEHFQRSAMFDAHKLSSDLQMEFAKNGIRWRMEDAARSGVHPLFALGAGGAAASSPSAVVGGSSAASVSGGPPAGGGSGGGSPVGIPNFHNPMAGFSGLGQDISRAIAAVQTPRERQADQINFMEVERHEWAREAHQANMMLAQSRLSRINQQTGKGMPESVSGLHEVKPAEVTASVPGRPDVTAGPRTPGVTWTSVAPGSITAMPSKDLNIDDFSSPGYSSWMIPNKLEPFFEKNASVKPPPDVWKQWWPHAQDVRYHFGNWYPVYDRPYPPFDGLRNAPGPRPGVVKGMFIDRR